MVVDQQDNQLDSDPGGPGGAMVAIALLVLIILLLVFLFRDELGIGSPTAEITIPDRFEAEIPAPPVDAEDEAPANEVTAAN